MDRHLAESLGSILSANHKRLMAGFGVIVCALSPLAALCERTNDRAAPALGADRAGPAYETRSSSRRSPGSRSREIAGRWRNLTLRKGTSTLVADVS